MIRLNSFDLSVLIISDGVKACTKQGCAFPMVIWPVFRMEKYRVNDHPYHAPQFIIFGPVQNSIRCPNSFVRTGPKLKSRPVWKWTKINIRTIWSQVIRNFGEKFGWTKIKRACLRVVQTQAILFLISMPERGGSDIERLWIWIRSSSIGFESIWKFNSRIVLCRIRLFPTLILEIKWLGSGLPLNVTWLHLWNCAKIWRHSYLLTLE